ncbi:MAG TPA: 16S rRNA (uracil(1498)-N(3))-methyltransferase, partial [Candidatus Akkermansia intestinigallinarum]|nr:16S rRNA (uracil(1498)-N(3))-methyltransferase [Candidatus Akkermansia intestinigallinarum]
MHRCCLPGADWSADSLLLEGEEAHHALRVMRLRPGDVCELFDGEGQAARVRVAAVSGASMRVEVEELL